MPEQPTTPEQVAAHVWTHVRRDGTVISWHQEDESAVQSKAEAVAMVQRTIDFWIVKLTDDLHLQRHVPLDEAKIMARNIFQVNIKEMSATPFAQRWGFSETDFSFP